MSSTPWAGMTHGKSAKWWRCGNSQTRAIRNSLLRDAMQKTTEFIGINNLTKHLGCGLLLALFLLSAQATAHADEILVSAAASLTDALKDIGRAYQLKGRHKILLTLGPSNFLARQIDEGAPVDIFFSADLAQMDLLDKNGRLEPGTRKNLLSNQLVIVVPKDSNLAIAAPKDLLKPEVKKIA